MEGMYDEFGNYVGPELSDGSGSEGEEEDSGAASEGDAEMEAAEAAADRRMGLADEDAGPSGMQVVLHEDKKYYPSADEVYGEGTETLLMDEDAQPIEEPIVKPVKEVKFHVHYAEPPETHVSPDFLAGLMSNPELIRNVTVAGHLHHGKTTLMDMFVEQTHRVEGDPEKPLRFTDYRLDELDRGISIKAVPMSLVMQGGSGKSYLCNLFDTPGHLNFSDETCCALRASDGVLLCVDAVEGVMLKTQRAVKAAVANGLAICLMLTKVDRIILELKLPPADAYHKLKHTIDEVNGCIAACPGGAAYPPLDPGAGNVAFGSCQSGWSFTLPSFAELYADVHGLQIPARPFAKRLWGNHYYDEGSRTFARQPAASGAPRSFLSFVLEPLYKIYSTVLGEDEAAVKGLLEEFGVYLKTATYKLDVKPLLKAVCVGVFGPATGVVDMLAAHVPSSRAGTKAKVERFYSGPHNSTLVDHMKACNPKGPLVVNVVKLFPKEDCTGFHAFGRIISGTVRPGEKVRVLGEAYTPDDEEDSALATVGSVWISQARYRVPITLAKAGNWVLLEGIDATVTKTATVVPEVTEEDVHIFAPIAFDTASVMKIAIEPINPQDLPKMVEGLRKINKSYPLAVTKVEESGEHTVLGTGELYLDSIMKDLREVYGEVEVKVADPVVSFCETVVETSSLKCFAETPNRKNKLTMIAEPLDKGLGEEIETGALRLDWPKKQVASHLQGKYDWDLLAARSIWAFGPTATGPNALLDDCLPGEVDKGLLNSIKSSVVQGFQWGAREGPLCDEPMRNVKMRLLDATIAEQPIHRSGGQVIPTARRVAYSAFLTAAPRLMEPVYFVEIQTPADCMSSIYNVLSRRRGHVTADVPKPGTPIYLVQAFIPVIESFGFETDLRYHTQGQAFCVACFDHWSIVPGDPLDKSIQLRPLEPAPIDELAREFMVKTRRRKGMSEDVSISRFFDDPMLLELAKAEAELGMTQ